MPNRAGHMAWSDGGETNHSNITEQILILSFQLLIILLSFWFLCLPVGSEGGIALLATVFMNSTRNILGHHIDEILMPYLSL